MKRWIKVSGATLLGIVVCAVGALLVGNQLGER